ncbi:MAG TPA: SDR family NAD(P)-dependent oxidoreductase [Anaeromyxobacter sp.]|nr:SDR family NAD(P)-dependent oxidoreductase [Anaeromyxobacter sp.]
MDHLKGAVALVTGASRGIGPHLVRALAAEGADVALAARDGAALENVAAAARASGVRAEAVAADLGRAAERSRLVRAAEAALGPIDVLVNNAGVESEGPFATLDPEVVAATVEVNFTAPVHLARLVVPGMIARRRGHVVNMASLGGKQGAPYSAVYCGTKAALVEWTSALRSELAGTGVSLSAICPGYVTGEGMFARFGIPPPRLLGSCTPEQVAAAVMRALRDDVPEIVVNSMPVRPLLAVAALFPRARGWFLERLGIVEFQRRKAGAPPV